MSDSWTDDSGIDGNYEDSDSSEPSESNEGSDTHEGSEPRGLRDIDNIRDVWSARTCYVSDDLAGELDRAWLEMQTELVDLDRDISKNRHFYPVVLSLGIDALREADSDELETKVDELHG